MLTMESIFGVSYPTIKSRLNRIGDQLDFVEVDSYISQKDILEQLDKGEIDINEALERLKP